MGAIVSFGAFTIEGADALSRTVIETLKPDQSAKHFYFSATARADNM